jgi:hypothetical protein
MGQAGGGLASRIQAFFAALAVKMGRKGAYRAYFIANPPRCLAGFAIAPDELSGISFDGHGEELNTIFRLSCRCGDDRHYVLGHYWRNPDYGNQLVFLSPIALRCEACERVTELIDTDRHGYDGELGGIVATKRGEGDRVEFACEECGPKPFRIWVRFEYPDDLFDRSLREFRGRQQDLFNWFSLIGQCSGCSRLRPVTDFECA